jgi:hypothetical protein
MQSLKPYEISQMFNYSLFVLSFPAGYFIAFWIPKKQKILLIGLALVVITFSIPGFQKDYAQYLAYPMKTIASNQYKTFSDITRQNIQKGSIMQLPSTILDRKQYNSWFRSETNMQMSAFTHASSFLAFTNIIYEESDVTKRLNLIAQVIALNTVLSASDAKVSGFQEQIQAVKQIFLKYNINYVVCPSRLDGLVKADLLSPVSEYPSERFYMVN